MKTTPAAEAPRVVWTPDPGAWARSRIGQFAMYLECQGLTTATDYEQLRSWSVARPEDFWAALADFFEVRFHQKQQCARTDDPMPRTRWFAGATLNYAGHILRNTSEHTAIHARSHTRGPFSLTYRQLSEQVARARRGLQRLGVDEGDRVVAYLPNVPETIVAFLATASLGAIWASCSPEFGPQAVVDRFRQLEPKVLLTVDGYRHRSEPVDRSGQNRLIARELDSVTSVVTVPYLDPSADAAGISWAALTSEAGACAADPVPFSHPLYVLFSSGTTGPPKAIVHGHGNMLLEHLKFHCLHCDVGPESVWVQPATTAWMVWNVAVSGLLTGAAITTFDGDVTYPDLRELWRLASDVGATHLGTAAAVITAAAKADLDVSGLDLSAVKEILSTGSPLGGEGFDWIQRRIRDDIPISSASGGTDVCSIFVGGSHVLPVTRGEITCRALAVAVEAFDQDGNSVVDQQGELVVTAPMLSMPVGFWGDDDGSVYLRSYFGTYPGVWRHGDWITITRRGTAIIPGRSDATLNRGGVRMGTAEFYGVLDAMPELMDSVVVHVERQDSEGSIVVLAVPQPSADGRPLAALIRQALRSRLSPRHNPDAVHLVPVLPRTMTNKRLEVPIKRILEGTEPSAVLSLDALTGADGVAALVRLAQDPISADRDERPIAGSA